MTESTGRNVGTLLVELLESYGVGHVFGVPGGQTLGLYQGILDRSHAPLPVRHVLMRDERSCVFAADAYARMSRKTGVCDATVGPGATNLVSGLAEAFASSIPLVAVISDVRREWSHLRHRSTASQTLEGLESIFTPITKSRCRIDVASTAQDVIDNAFRIANAGRPGPVVLEIPEDVFLEDTDDLVSDIRRPQATPWYRCAPDPSDVEEAAKLITDASKPVIVAGGGVFISRAEAELAALASLIGAPVVTTFSGRGVISDLDPLSVGVLGLMGNHEANAIAEQSDVMILVGTKLGQFSTKNWQLPSPGTATVHIDVDPATFDRRSASVGLWADARLGLKALLDALPEKRSDLRQWNYDEIAGIRQGVHSRTRDETRLEGPLRPQDVIETLNDSLSPTDILVCDASLSSGWGTTLYDVREAGRTVLTPRGFAGLGWGLPAAIGAALASPTRRVVCLAGDGAWGYSMCEVETLARLELPVLSLVLNNGILAWSKHGQLRRLEGRTLSTEFAPSNYAASADGLGARGVSVSSLPALHDAIGEWDREPFPTVLDIATDGTETPVLPAT